MYERFSKLLQENEVSAYKVSKATKIPQSTLSDWKRGISSPKYDKLKKIAEYFGVSVGYLKGETDIKEDFENDPDYYVPDEYKNLGKSAEDYYRFKQAEAEDAQREQGLYSVEVYTEHEQKVITAYRNQPEMQPAVDKLLGIDDSLDLVARGGKQKVKVKKEAVNDWTKQLKSEPYEKDEDLC